MGRRQDNATYFASQKVDDLSGAAFAMDLTPLLTSPVQDIEAFVQNKINRFADDVQDRFRRVG